MLPCIAAVAIATVVGKKTFRSHVHESDKLLMANIEALTNSTEDGKWKSYTHPCPRPVEYKIAVICEYGYGKEYTLPDCVNSDC